MATYAILTRLSPDAIADPSTIDRLGQEVTAKLNVEVPEAKWIASYAVLGPHATTETWPVTPWERFRDLLRTTSA
jgi:hypothetical protein